MDDKVLVGVLIGLVVGSSTFIWNSESFTKPQKIGLLLCLVFPPLQWLGIIVLLIYNNYSSTDSVEKVAERKVEEVKNDLDNLKQKGILTDEEYNQKVSKINQEKTEQDLKNSLEYKQLKSLFDSGILTKEEFESKISLIKETPIKKVSVEEAERLKAYVENIKLPTNEEPKKENSNNIFVYLSVVIIVVLFLLFVISQNTEDTTEQIYDSQPLPAVDTSTYEGTNNYQEPIKLKKFVYVVFNVETPKLDKFTIEGTYDDMTNLYNPSKTFYSTTWEKLSFSTDILEIEDYNEDNKNRVLDQTESKMYERLSIYDINYNSDVVVNCNDDRKKEELKEAKSRIIDRNIYDFDSYSEASISKRNK